MIEKINNIVINNSSLSNLIKPSYTLDDLEEIEKFFNTHDTLKLIMKENGLYPAVTTEEKESVSGYTNVWIRDTIMITNYQREVESFNATVKTIKTLRDYFYKYQLRFKNIIEKKVDKSDCMQRPHVRFNGDTLEEIDQKWAHAQNDALGYALWMTFKLANENKYHLTSKDYEVYSLFPFYFEAIEYWHDGDNGHWEEAAKVESSSIGVVVAGLEEMKRFIEQNSSKIFEYNNNKIEVEKLKHLINKGRKQLNEFLPYESPPKRKADAALLFLLYPLEIVHGNQSQEILSTVLDDLKGTYGIKRYIKDSYWCGEYKKLLKEDERTADFSDDMGQRDKMLKSGQEAQWCIFDPIVSVIYGRKYLRTGNNEYLKEQIHYFNRSLGQITADDCPYGAGKCPESYYIEDAATNIYVPNDHVPLAWTQANLGTAFNYVQRTLHFK